MNRRDILLALGFSLIASTSLMASPPKAKQSSCKDCKKCGPQCKCDCKKVCKCNPGCCGRPPAHGKPQARPTRGRSYDGRPSRGRSHEGHPSRGRTHTPPSHGRTHGIPAPHPRGSSSIISKFDKNKDGKLDEKERAEARKYFTERYKNHRSRSSRRR